MSSCSKDVSGSSKRALCPKFCIIEVLQVTLWNFLEYNVAGGGKSARFGTEPAAFYLLNGGLNFNAALPLALLSPALFVLARARLLSAPATGRLAVAVLPLFVWLPAISALPHKEERFLYVTYPQVRLLGLNELAKPVEMPCLCCYPRSLDNCSFFTDRVPRAQHTHTKACMQIALAAATALSAMPRLASDLPAACLRVSPAARGAALLAGSLVISASRTTAVIAHYGAPMAAWHAVRASVPVAKMPKTLNKPAITVCVGAEWHRFPSAFFLPRGSELAFVPSAFGGAHRNYAAVLVACLSYAVCVAFVARLSYAVCAVFVVCILYAHW